MNKKRKESFVSTLTGDRTGQGGTLVVFGEDIEKSKQYSYLSLIFSLLLSLSIGIFMFILATRKEESEFLKRF